MSNEDKSSEEVEAMEIQAPIIKLCNAVIHQAIYHKVAILFICPEENCVKVIYKRFEHEKKDNFEVMTIPKNLQAPLTARFKKMATLDPAKYDTPQSGLIQVDHREVQYNVGITTEQVEFGEKLTLEIALA